MALIKNGKKIKPKKKVTAKIVLSRIFVFLVLIIVPVYLLSLIKVFLEGGERLPERTICAVIIMPAEENVEDGQNHFLNAINTAIDLKEKRMTKYLIFTGFKGHFSDLEIAAIRQQVFKSTNVLVTGQDLIFTRPMRDYEDMAVSIEQIMNQYNLDTANLVNSSYYMAKTMLYFKRVDRKLRNNFIFKGMPYIISEEQKRRARDWWYIYREALYYIYYFLFEHPGGRSRVPGAPNVS